MFSPYYAAARRRAPADPLQHCAFNVALSSARGRFWTMTERGRRDVERDREHLRIGPSVVAWRDGALEVDLDERCAPWPAAVRGRLRLHPQSAAQTSFALDGGRQHHWSPIAPLARVEVELDAPPQRWQGDAYLDANDGDAPLESAFSGWTWSRARQPDGTALIHYDVTRRHGSALTLALTVGRDGSIVPADPAMQVLLPPTRWGLQRRARGSVALECTLEDGPFYARSLLRGDGGTRVVHESLSLDRFRRRWVQALLPFRMPRRA